MPQIQSVGIDVSKSSLEIAFKEANQYSTFSILNQEEAIMSFAASLRRKKYVGKIIIESTSHYHMLVAKILAAKGLDVRVINPIITKKYLSSQIRKLKTDKADSKILANIALLEDNLPCTYQTSDCSEKIRLQLGILNSVEKQIQIINGTLKTFQESANNLNIQASDQEKILDSTLKQLKKAKEKLQQELITSIELVENQEKIDNLCSIPGVSRFVACLIAYYFDPKLSKKAWIAFAGLDISVSQSGSWRGRGKISKRGKPYLRKRLFGCAWGAVTHSPDFKKYYESLKRKSRRYTEILVIISRKLLCIAHAIVSSNTPYCDSYLKNSNFT
jgi:transposase